MPAQVKFILHNEKNGYADIQMKYLCLDGKYFRRSMRQRIKVSNWDPGKERMKPGAHDSSSLNEMMDAREKQLNDAVRLLIGKDLRITKGMLASQMKGGIMTFWEFYDSLIANPPASWGKARVKDYKKLGSAEIPERGKRAGILRRFEKRFGEINFHSIDQHFADELTNFMRNEIYQYNKSGEPQFYNDNTINAVFRKIRGLISFAIKYKVINHGERITTSARGIDAGAVYLTQNEIELIYKTGNKLPDNLTSKNELNKYSDWFVLGTQMGCRIGYLDVSMENKTEINGKTYLDLSTNKNPVPVIIPLSSLAIEILEKYNWNIKNVNDVMMNRYIKIVCEYARLNQNMIHRAIEGGKLIERSYRKFELVSSHSMRRSFATNMFKLKVPIPLIMKITGHKTMVSFMKYIRIENQESAELLGDYLK